jgi:HTH-type transcriptional regulator/antitoxin HigA
MMTRDSYFALVQEFPITVIRDDVHLASAQEMLDKLTAKQALDDGEEQYLEVLTELVELYEEKILIDAPSDSALLQHLMEASEVSQANLAKETGIPKSTISEILAGKRSFSKAAIAAFSEFFSVPKKVFVSNL